jgi:hypothetical protein
MQELDPTGKDPHTPGAKLDAGKLRVNLVLSNFPLVLEKICEVGTYGANKYTDNGWLEVPDGINRYRDAEGRHQLAVWKGEKIDTGSGLEHEAHRLWNALASYELALRLEG